MSFFVVEKLFVCFVCWYGMVIYEFFIVEIVNIEFVNKFVGLFSFMFNLIK